MLPFLTAELPGIGGRYKTTPDDFFVEELPLYPADGQGTHTYVLIEKTGITTPDAVAKIAAALGVKRKEIGFAGLKDARAVTRQWLSIEHANPDRIDDLDIPNIKICDLTQHTNKIKIGHLAANRFVIRLRNLTCPPDESLTRAQTILDALTRRGVPNYFGPQRFGSRSDSHELGQALFNNNTDLFFDLFLGRPKPDDSEPVADARRLYDLGQLEKALKTWPRTMRDHRRTLQALINSRGNKNKAFRNIEKFLIRFLISAFQAHVFNLVLAQRLDAIDKILPGDFAWLHRNNKAFHTLDPAAEQPRCDAFEISPTGPIIGRRMTQTADLAAQIENKIFDQLGITQTDMQNANPLAPPGSRRPLRFQPQNTSLKIDADTRGQFLELGCTLPPSCYATTLLRELTKSPD